MTNGWGTICYFYTHYSLSMETFHHKASKLILSNLINHFREPQLDRGVR